MSLNVPQDQNVWFSVSMGLIGLIVGFVVANVLNNGSFTFGQPAAPLAPTVAGQPTAPSVPIDDRLLAIAGDIGLNTDSFKECLASTKYTEAIKTEMDLGNKAGVNGTPGNILVNLKTETAWLISGAQPFENFKASIDAMMASPEEKDLKPPATLGGTVATSNVPPVDVNKEHIRGNKSAQFALIEYSDFQCPFCQRVHPTYQQMMDAYGDDVMWVYRHFPLYQIHPDAEKMAIGSECAAEQNGNDAFWGYADKLFAG